MVTIYCVEGVFEVDDGGDVVGDGGNDHGDGDNIVTTLDEEIEQLAAAVLGQNRSFSNSSKAQNNSDNNKTTTTDEEGSFLGCDSFGSCFLLQRCSPSVS
jgi:hypothetical protein